MEMITHNLIAVIIQILCFKFLFFPLNIILTIIFAFLSHIISDSIAIITYHTPEVQKGDTFWITWHIIIYLLSIFSIIIFIPFWLALVFANVMDIWDWFILRPIQNIKKKTHTDSIWGDKYYFHPIIDKFRDKFFYWLPKWNYEKGGVLIEICVIIMLVIFIIILR
ncbi:MAG: hypothetical protein ACXABO_07700 [Promethearchaeota archaeon]